MTGASRNHNLIAANTNRSLGSQLDERPCEVYQSDMRVRVPSTGLYTYPDVVVVCGKPEFEDKELDTLLNPTLIIEVLSPSTEQYDRGKKFQDYRSIPSFREYIMIAQERAYVEHFVRQGVQWLFTEASTLDSVLTLSSIECTLTLSDIYKKVSFEPEERPNP